MSSTNKLVAEMVEAGASNDEIYWRLIQDGIFRIENGQLYSINSSQPLASGVQKARGALRVSVGNPGRPISAPRLAWMIHAQQQVPPGMSVVQLGDRRDYSKENLALVARGQENRLHTLVRKQ